MADYLGRMHLVTGATGIVGSHVLLECAARGPVRALYRRGSDRSIVEKLRQHYHPDATSLLSAIEWVEADILDVVGLSAAMQGIRHVYHTAAVVSFSPADAAVMQEVNVTGTANVVNAALEAGVRRLCHVSSTAAIGDAADGVVRDESLPWNENGRISPYSASKYAAELEVQRGIAEGLDAVMVNPCVIIGPGPAGRSSMTLVERLRDGTRFYPPGSNAVVDARDVAQCMLALVERGATGERYLLVGENISYKRLFGLLSKAFQRPAPHILLRPWMLELGWRVERLRTLITGSTPFVTRDTAHSARSQRAYSSAKVESLLGHRFRTAQEAVANVVTFLGERAAH